MAKAKPKAKIAAKKVTAKKASAKKASAKKVAVKTAAPGAKAKAKTTGAFARPLEISEALAAVVGTKPLPRTEVVKSLWVYIKKHNLQDPKNKRMINADDKLKAVFGKPSADMFEMTKLVSKHLK